MYRAVQLYNENKVRLTHRSVTWDRQTRRIPEFFLREKNLNAD